MKEEKKQVKLDEFEERIVEIRRVSKKISGGSAIGFAALAVVGNKNGTVGFGYGKAKDVSECISKALSLARRNLVHVKIKETTIPHDVCAKYGATEVYIKPAPKGSGVIAGGSVRVVLDLAGIKDVSSKMLGSNNKIANIRCTFKALSKLKM